MRLLEFFYITEDRSDSWLADVIYDQLVRGDWTSESGYQSEDLLDEIEAETGIDLNAQNPEDKKYILDFIERRYLSGRNHWTPKLKGKLEKLRRSGQPIEIYRGMSMGHSEIEAIITPDSIGRGYGSTLPLGRFWTWDFNMASEMSGGRGGISVILHAVINPDNIDWAETMAANAIWGEREIRPEHGSELKLINILEAGSNKVLAEPNPKIKYIAEDINERNVGNWDVIEKLDEARSPIPTGLEGLAAEAKKAGSFDEFRNDFLRQIKHGIYWHITENPNFDIDPATGPRDMSSLAVSGSPEAGKLMITSDLEHWHDYYNTNPETGKREIRRPYAALIDMSEVPRQTYRQVGRGMGNEFMVSDPSNARVVSVLPIKKAFAYDRRVRAKLPSSEDELREFYEIARNISTSVQTEDLTRPDVCAPLAIARALGLPYDDVFQTCSKFELWKPRIGMRMIDIQRAIERLGWQVIDRKDLSIIKKKSRQTGVEHFAWPTLNQLMKKLQPNEKYIIGLRGHVIAYVDGRVHDDSEFGKKHKVNTVFQIISKDESQLDESKYDKPDC